MKFNKKIAVIAGVAAVAVIGGTFAYYNQQTSLDNPLNTGNYNTVLVEDFTPPTDEIKPGQHWDKVVSAKNQGDYPVLVRIKMEEKWTRTDNPAMNVTISSIGDRNTKNAAFNSASPTKEGSVTYYTAVQAIHDGQGDPDTDGYVSNDDSVIFKVLSDNSKWVDGGDGYWYWDGVLAPEIGATEPIMNELIMASNIDMGHYTSHEFYTVVKGDNEPAADAVWTEATLEEVIEKAKELETSNAGKDESEKEKLYRKSESKVDDGRLGYSDANYTLTITSDFVQANAEAVAASWKDFDLRTLTNVTVNDDSTLK